MVEIDDSDQLSLNRREKFLNKIRDQIEEWIEEQDTYEYKELLKHTPDFFYLLHRLSTDEEVSSEKRSVLENAMFYFVLPMDVIPEGVLGAEGYVDDVIISAHVLDDNFNEEEESLLKKYWSSDTDPVSIIDRVLESAEDWAGERRYKKIQDWIQENT